MIGEGSFLGGFFGEGERGGMGRFFWGGLRKKEGGVFGVFWGGVFWGGKGGDRGPGIREIRESNL